MLPNRSLIELRDTKDLLDRIMDSIPDYASATFERIGMEFLQGIGREGRLPAKFSLWGRWWDRENEIDIVALNKDTLDILLCECKWQKRKIDVDEIKHLLHNAPFVNWFNENRRGHFAFISKSGFTKEAVEFARDNGVLLFDLKEMKDYFD